MNQHSSGFVSDNTQGQPGPAICGFAPELKAFLDNELSPLLQARVKAHLLQCPECRQTVAEIRSIEMEMRKMGVSESALHPELRTRLVDGLSGMASDIPDIPDPPRRRPLWQRKPWLVFGGGGATVAASVMVFFSLYLPMVHRHTADATAVAAGMEVPVAPPVPMGAAAEAPMAASEPAPAAVAPEMAELSSPPLIERQITREATLGIAVDNVEDTNTKIVNLVESTGGYVANNQLSVDPAGFKFAELTVRIPVKDFGSLQARITSLGSLRSKEDITEQIREVQAAEDALNQRLREISDRLSEKPGPNTTSEQRNQLNMSREQILRQLEQLKKQASLSTIHITLTEKAKEAVKQSDSGFFGDLKETNRAANAAFQAAIRVPVVMGIWILAFSPIWAPLILIYRYLSLKSRK